MKRSITALFLCVVLSVQCSAYDNRLTHVLEQLRDCQMECDENLPVVGGPAVGEAAAPHVFYMLIPYVLRIASEEDLKEMLSDKSPVVRIMGAKCAVKRRTPALGKIMDELEKDQARVYVMPYGCGVTKWTVGEVVTELKIHPAFLEDEEEWQPKQQSEHSTGSTSASSTEPGLGAAHH